MVRHDLGDKSIRKRTCKTSPRVSNAIPYTVQLKSAHYIGAFQFVLDQSPSARRARINGAVSSKLSA